MVFTSLNYALFLPVVVIIFLCTADRARWCVLLLASLAFYGAFKVPYLLLVLLIVAAATYAGGLLLGSESRENRRKIILWSGIIFNLLVLICLKYLHFLSTALNQGIHLFLPGTSIPESPLLVSVGVSYYVFQAVSYLIDVYLEIEEPERHFGRLTLFLGFFPKMLQGPIERAGSLLPQLRAPFLFSYEEMRTGLFFIASGLFKKVVIADRLAPFVNSVYDNVHAHTGIPFVIATYLYALQIYFDFSGYTDMALGAGRMFGIRLTQNFNSPYLATSIADFWRRWHISFSRWILDYIFKPLQMQMRDWKNFGSAAALLVTFLISGLWHGAGWNYIAWGALHGMFLAASIFYKPFQKRIHLRLGLQKTRLLTAWQRLVTFHLVCFAWIFFRSNDVKDAVYVVGHLFSGSASLSRAIAENLADFSAIKQILKPLLLGQPRNAILVLAVALAFIQTVAHLQGRDEEGIFRHNIVLRWTVYYLITMGVLFFGAFNTTQQFIYVQF